MLGKKTGFAEPKGPGKRECGGERATAGNNAGTRLFSWGRRGKQKALEKNVKHTKQHTPPPKKNKPTPTLTQRHTNPNSKTTPTTTITHKPPQPNTPPQQPLKTNTNTPPNPPKNSNPPHPPHPSPRSQNKHSGGASGGARSSSYGDASGIPGIYAIQPRRKRGTGKSVVGKRDVASDGGSRRSARLRKGRAPAWLLQGWAGVFHLASPAGLQTSSAMRQSWALPNGDLVNDPEGFSKTPLAGTTRISSGAGPGIWLLKGPSSLH